jgi:hypothetical protein
MQAMPDAPLAPLQPPRRVASVPRPGACAAARVALARVLGAPRAGPGSSVGVVSRTDRLIGPSGPSGSSITAMGWPACPLVPGSANGRAATPVASPRGSPGVVLDGRPRVRACWRADTTALSRDATRDVGTHLPQFPLHSYSDAIGVPRGSGARGIEAPERSGARRSDRAVSSWWEANAADPRAAS